MNMIQGSVNKESVTQFIDTCAGLDDSERKRFLQEIQAASKQLEFFNIYHSALRCAKLPHNTKRHAFIPHTK